MNSRVPKLFAVPLVQGAAPRDPAIDLRIERLRIARLERRLQEDVGQQLAGISLLLAAARHAAPAEDAATHAAMDRVARLLDEAIGHCRVDVQGG